jgi:hypothetical protein
LEQREVSGRFSFLSLKRRFSQTLRSIWVRRLNAKQNAKSTLQNTQANGKSDFGVPYIEDGRWMIELPRKTTDAAALLKEKLADGGKSAGVADLIAKTLQKELKVQVNSEILEVYVGNADFALFLTDFLLGKPFWLKTK